MQLYGLNLYKYKVENSYFQIKSICKHKIESAYFPFLVKTTHFFPNSKCPITKIAKKPTGDVVVFANCNMKKESLR